MATITEFLTERLEEDRVAATRAPDPVRAVAEHAAKVAIVGLHTPYRTPQEMVYGTVWACSTCGNVDDDVVEWPCDTLVAVAGVYAAHPEHDPSWGQ